VALAVADTFEAAKAAADAVLVTYDKQKPNVETDLKPTMTRKSFKPRTARRIVCKASAAIPMALSPARRLSSIKPLSRRPKRITPIELQAATAIWDGQNLTLYEESQSIFNMRDVLAQMFGLPKENVR
jgi:xanthine dehydrogenase YagR molybdenum-binding subunit